MTESQNSSVSVARVEICIDKSLGWKNYMLEAGKLHRYVGGLTHVETDIFEDSVS